MDSSPAPRRGPKRVRLLYARRVSLFTALVALPGFIITVTLLSLESWSLTAKATILFFELFAWWLLALALQEHATRPLQTLANVVAALREEDYSFRSAATTLAKVWRGRVACSWSARASNHQAKSSKNRIVALAVRLQDSNDSKVTVMMKPGKATRAVNRLTRRA